MGCLTSSRSVTRLLICTTSLAVCPTHCINWIYWNPANLEATIEAEWILNSLSSCKNGIFQWGTITSLYVRHASIDGTFYDFSVIRNVRMIRVKNCEKLPKFVKVTTKILSVIFFRTWCMAANDTGTYTDQSVVCIDLGLLDTLPAFPLSEIGRKFRRPLHVAHIPLTLLTYIPCGKHYVVREHHP